MTLPAAILMGGYAKRMGALTEVTPKALFDVNGQPFIARQLKLLASQGLRRAVLCVAHLGGLIEAEVGDGARFGLQVEYSYDGERLMGTAGAIARALDKLGPAFFTLYGDSYLECDLAAVQGAFEGSEKSGLMSVFRNDNRWGPSNVEYASGKILKYDKKRLTATMRHIDYGIGAFKRAVFERLPGGFPRDLETVYQDLLVKGDLAAFEATKRFYEIGSPEGIAELRRYLAD